MPRQFFNLQGTPRARARLGCTLGLGLLDLTSTNSAAHAIPRNFYWSVTKKGNAAEQTLLDERMREDETASMTYPTVWEPAIIAVIIL